MTGADHESRFLPSLTTAFKAINVDEDIATAEFVDACDKVMPIFDHIGAVFYFAKHEMETKKKTVAAEAAACPTLSSIVAKAKAEGNITVKNSPGRNLHRLLNTIMFISAIFKGLRVGKTLKDAVSEAYDATLGLLHAWLVRTGIKAGMIGLPSREHFLQSIGETEDTAKEHGEGFIEAADTLCMAISSLYAGVKMPVSDFKIGWG